MNLNHQQRRQLETSSSTAREDQLKWSDVKDMVTAEEVEIVSTEDHPNLVPNTLLEVNEKARKITPRKSKTIKVIGKSEKKQGDYTVRIDSGKGVLVDVPADTLTQLYQIKGG